MLLIQLFKHLHVLRSKPDFCPEILDDDDNVELDKSNVLLVGPIGSSLIASLESYSSWHENAGCFVSYVLLSVYLFDHMSLTYILLNREDITGKNSCSLCECSFCHCWYNNFNTGEFMHRTWVLKRKLVLSSCTAVRQDCTRFRDEMGLLLQAGYVGEDVESILYKLLTVSVFFNLP